MIDSITLSQHLISLMLMLIACLISASIAYHNKLYHLPTEHTPLAHSIALKQVFIALGIALFIQIFLTSLLYVAWLAISDIMENSIHVYLNLIGACFSLFVLRRYCKTLPLNDQRHIIGLKIFNNKSEKFLTLMSGVVTWIFAYPWVLFMGQLVLILMALFHVPYVDQVAVQYIQEIISNPVLLIVACINVIIIIPIIEELVFRGFLQSYLKQWFGRIQAIVVTSIIFALFHFSITQGMNNIRIIGTLFVLSCFLGFIKEKQESLLASIALHATFNASTILMMLYNPTIV